MVPLLLSFVLASDLRLEIVRHSLTGTHCRYREYVDGQPTDNWVIGPCDAAGFSLPVDAGRPKSATPRFRRVIVEEESLPWAHDYDAETGALIRRVPLFFRGKPARVFDPNPVVALNDPALRDQNDAASAVPAAAYRDVELDVEDSGPLRGPHVALIDAQAPFIAPPDASAPLRFNRNESGFEDVNAYFHIDANQRYLQSLGYVGERGIAAYTIEVDAHAANGTDNSFFVPSRTRLGQGTLSFGEGGTDDAEDADLVVHEYAHAIHEWIAPSAFGGTFASQSRAISEGFADYWAYSTHLAERMASGRDPFCFADWDARCWENDPSEQCAYPPGMDCLRRLDSPRTMADYETTEGPSVDHRNGMIWSSALREIHQRIGKQLADTIVLESLFDAPPSPTFAAMAQRMIAVDQLLYGGVHANLICEAMIARGILANCRAVPRGERTFFQSSQRGIAIPDNNPAGIVSEITLTDPRVIEELFVRVDITHPSRGDLRVELIAPNGTTAVLKEVSIERTRDVHTTFGLTATPADSLEVFRGLVAAGTWKLRVTDFAARDIGTLLSWALVLRLEGDERLDTRPRAERSQMIPVVAHLYGVGATAFASDVRIANPSSVAQTATLIFTRSGDDGRTSFAAIDVVLAPQQTVAFDDVVESAFATAGSGSLEVTGDVIVMSRTYALTDRGTIGQQVPPGLDTTSLGAAPLVVTPLPEAARFNFGITETAGASGTVRAAGRDLTIAPFSHTQFPVDDESIEIRVVEGDARVVAYVSQIADDTGDPMFISAESLPSAARTLISPAISAEGANGTFWRTDLWITSRAPEPLRIEAIGAQRPVVEVTLEPVTTFEDVLARLFHRTVTLAALEMTLPRQTIGATRIRTDGFSQFVQLLTPDGPDEQHLLFIESGGGYRTNIGIVTDEPATAEVVVYDNGGSEIQRSVLSTSGGIAQTAVLTPVINGRAVVRFTGGRGRAYASLVDNGTGDATFVAQR